MTQKDHFWSTLAKDTSYLLQKQKWIKNKSLLYRLRLGISKKSRENT